ncbi:hypothetical protein [Chryseobacterium sp.]|uniref:hypothetical protein n=1 Tax=Chryseobacterium sp. TaxID=1871047 RepID=UPI002FC80F35
MKSILQISFISLIGLIYGIFSKSTSLLPVQNEFLITFVGVVLGMATTIVTFIFSSVDKIWNIIDINNTTDSLKCDKLKTQFKKGYRELIEDSKFIFIIFIILFILAFWENIDIPYIALENVITKVNLIYYIKIGLFLNSIVAIKDLFFSLINLLKLVLFDDSTKA